MNARQSGSLGAHIFLSSNSFTSLGLAKPLSATLMFDYPTIEALAEHLLDHLAAMPPVAVAITTKAALATGARFDAQRLAEMSESEVEAMLLKRLGA